MTLSLTRCGPEETGGIPELAEAEVAGRLEVRRDLAAIPSGFSPLTEGGGAHELSVIGGRIRRTDADVILIPSADSVACARETRPTDSIDRHSGRRGVIDGLVRPEAASAPRSST